MIGNGKYVSIETIINKVYRDLGATDDLNISDAIEWAGEAMEFIGATVYLKEKVESVSVSDYKAKLPCDLHYINTVAGVQGTFEDDECPDSSTLYTPMTYTTDAFHHWRCGQSQDHCCDSRLTYDINDDYIFPNFEEGKLLISYKALPTDERGYPMIPDDIKFKAAVSSHISWRIGFIRWISGKIPGQVYQKLEQDRDWYLGAAQTRDKMPSYDMAENLKNAWTRLIPKLENHSTGFKNIGNQENRNKHQ